MLLPQYRPIRALGEPVGELIPMWVLWSSRMFAFASPSIVRWLVNVELRTVMFFAPLRIEPPRTVTPSSVNPLSPVSNAIAIATAAPACGRSVIALAVPLQVP